MPVRIQKKAFVKKLLNEKKVDLHMDFQFSKTPLELALDNEWDDIAVKIRLCPS
ncbi:MAG: hypothetical protein ACI8RA_002388 [Chlamydiales bacterium]|jgi:hypothetical protein